MAAAATATIIERLAAGAPVDQCDMRDIAASTSAAAAAASSAAASLEALVGGGNEKSKARPWVKHHDPK